MSSVGQDSLKTRRTLVVDGASFDYFSLEAAASGGGRSWKSFPIAGIAEGAAGKSAPPRGRRTRRRRGHQGPRGASHRPRSRARDRLSAGPRADADFTGVPAVVDLAAMRDAVVALGGDPRKINPLSPVDLVIDHSVMVDYYGGPDALSKTPIWNFQRNGERYAFLRWGQTAFDNFRVVPRGPASATRGIANIWPRWCGRPRTARGRWPTPTPWSAPTATPPWSTA